jgi:hypothetical protein
MVKFLNQFSRKSKQQTAEQNAYLGLLFDSFLQACSGLAADVFIRNNRFNVALYESVFAAACGRAFSENRAVQSVLAIDKVKALEQDSQFVGAMLEGTTQTKNVKLRLDRARVIVGAL